jgi:putative ABC transport system permease protein
MPNWKSAIAQRLPNLNINSDVIEELSQHLDDRYQELLSEAHNPDEAEHIALAELDHHDLLAKQFPLPRTSLLTDLVRDLRFGFRTLRKQRLFTVIAVFSVVNGVLLRPLPFPEPNQLVWIWDTQPQLPKAPASLPDFIDWHDQNKSFESLAAYQSGSMFLDTGEGSRDTTVGLVTPEFFSVFHTQPLLGRTFTAEETQPGKFRVIVLSHALWQNDFGSDPNVIGRTIQASGFPYTIIGVMPKGFSYPDRALFWRPLPIDPAQLNRGPHYLRIVGRLRTGVSLSEAQADMSTIATRLAQQYPEKIAGHNVKLESLRDVVVGDIGSTLMVLLGAVGFVLLIACANVANLLLAKIGSRQREIAVRAALGASRFRIVRQLLVESILLGTAGGVVGLAVAIAGVKWLTSLGPDTIPRLGEISIDPRMTIFALFVSVATGLFFGAAPALQISRPNLTDVLKEGGRGSGGVQRGRLRKILIVSEVALSLVLVTGAGLLIRSFSKLNRIEPGFNTSRVLTIGIALFKNKYPDNPQVAGFYSQLLEKAAQTPGVTAVAAIAGLPLTGSSTTNSFTIIGRPAIRKEDEPTVEYGVVTPKYFEVMSIPLLMGRDITDRDTRQSPNVGVINELLAKRFFGDTDPIGQQIHLQGQERDPITIVGVVGNVRQYGLDEQPMPEVYVPYIQDPLSTNLQRALTIVVRTENDPGAVASSLRGQVTSLDRSLPIYALKPMNEYVYDSLSRRRFNLTLLSVFGVVALLLAAVGIYGVISYSVSQRIQEIGIRLALGAKTRDVLLMVVRQGMVLALAGIVIGMLGAFVLTRLMRVLLFEVSPTDPVTFVATGSLLVLVALLACLIPARRATRVDPLIALRYE